MAVSDNSQSLPLDSRRFVARERLWQGHHCDSWLGYDRSLDRTVVIKVAYSDDPAAMRRLAHEVEVHRSLTHPTLVGLLDADLSCATPHLILEHAPASLCSAGRATNAQVLRTALTDLIEAALQLDALDLRHDRLIPQHVLLDWGGRAQLCGLGHVVRVTAKSENDTGTPVGVMLSHRMARSESAFAIARAIVGVALEELDWHPKPDVTPRRVVAVERPDLLHDDPVIVGVLDAMLHPEPTLRLELEAARDMLLRPTPLLVH